MPGIDLRGLTTKYGALSALLGWALTLCALAARTRGRREVR